MATARDSIAEALQELGVLAAGETPTAEDAALGLVRLNNLIDEFKVHDLLVYSQTRTTATVTTAATYSIGTGGDINVARPSLSQIQAINYVDTTVTPNVEFNLGQYSNDDWTNQAIKDLTAPRPTNWYYDATFPNGTLYPWPIPTDSGLLWAVYTLVPVDEVTLDTVIALPPGWKRMLATNLAVEMASSFNREASQSLMARASNSLARVKVSNYSPEEIQFESAALVGGGAGYNIRTDGYWGRGE